MNTNTIYDNGHVKKSYTLSVISDGIGRLLLSPFVGKVVTFCRKKDGLLSPFVGKVVTFCREGCHLLSGANSSSYSFSINYNKGLIVINNLKNNLMNYSNKLFDKGESLSKTFLGGFGALAFNNRATV